MLDHSNFNLLFSLISFAVIISLLCMACAKRNLTRIFAFSSFSIIICLVYLLLDAPDVAMTEAAIGACLSTVVLILFATKVPESDNEKSFNVKSLLAIISSICTIIFFVILQDILPKIGDSANIINSGVADYYLENTVYEIGVPAFVAAILASYRGLDTLCETAVILIAAVAIYGILGLKDEEK